MKKRKWRKGPPPSIGWWPASLCQDEQCIRWWSGESWSVGCFKDDSSKTAAKFALQPSPSNHRIEWTDRWWL